MEAESFDVLIENGLIIDGTGAPGYYADLGIRDGRIARLGNLAGCSAERRIDATGQIVAPGHITNHTHYDATLFWDPYCLDSGVNGVTTVVNANCGFGFAPVRKRDVERTMAMMVTTEQIPIHHQRAAMSWDWESFPDWLDRLRNLPKGLNVLSFLPLNPLLVYVMGVDAAKTRSPSKDEMAEIHRLINEAMDAGAIGISMSVMGAEGNSHVDFDGTPMPTDSMSEEAILEIGRAVVERGEGVIQMLTQIAFHGNRPLTEKMAEMAKGSGVRVIHNVFVTTDLLPQMVSDDLTWLDEQRAQGRDITVGCLINRGWVEAGIKELDTAAGQLQAVRRIVTCKDDDELRALLRDAEFVAAFSSEYLGTAAANGAATLEGQTVISVGDHEELLHAVGRTLGELAEEAGESVVECLARLGLASDLALQLKSPYIGSLDPAQPAQLMRHSATVPGGSDGGAHTKSFEMGQWATDLLLWLARDTRTMSLEELHFQLSLKNARSVQIPDRGALLAGYWADLLVYDLEELYFDMSSYQIVHDMPKGDWRRSAKAGGYRYILVNGEITHERDQPTGETPGTLVQVTTAGLGQARRSA